jgi:diacylglycerol kinase (ATP)
VSSSTLAIVNPASAFGATGRRWGSVEPHLRRVLGELDVEHTDGPRDAERIARDAVRGGVERLVVVGGDGTTSEVVTGLLDAELGDAVEVGVLPAGTGGDLARRLGVPGDMRSAIEALGRGVPRRIDAGRVRYRTFSGKDDVRYFINVASFGLSGLVDQCVERVPRRVGGTLSYLAGTLMALAKFDRGSASINVDGAEVYDGPVVLGAVANGAYFGGGMKIAPEADYADGELDLVVIGALSKLALIRNLPSIYSGRHIEHPQVFHHRGRVIEASATSGEVLFEIDGDCVGQLPARIEVLPGAITLFGLTSGAGPGRAS